ncbi:uncharacterized protein LOC113273081 [Papaver somniferum]|uniref:uncharacterized protein LOC113273081 n=1 Tax=Papaver somniferum TaxID=3469 RepID=UPI000E6FF17C|nr:uncharacterized protein LOC113273081 [Papaver somniferum]
MNFYPNFDLEKQTTSHATVWVSFPGLYIELWTKKILLSIAKILGKPIAIDQKTLDHDVGNYAAVLIDIDFAKEIPKRIYQTTNGKKFWQYIEIQDLENIKFCTHCKFMGHKFENCLAAKKILGGSNAVKKSPTVTIKNDKEGKSIKSVWKKVGEASHAGHAINVNNVKAGKEGINSVHEVAVYDDIEKSGNVIMESIHEKSDDKQLEEQLEKAFNEYREAQIKLMRCKNNISAKKDLALRDNSVHIDNADSRQGKLVQTREAQQESVQTREAQQESVQIQSVQTSKAQQESVSKKNLEDIPNIQSGTKYDSENPTPISVKEITSNSVFKQNPTRPTFITNPGKPKEDWKIVMGNNSPNKGRN